jgi:hypothetical protein
MREKLVARYGTAEMLCFSIRRTMMVDVGFLTLFMCMIKEGLGRRRENRNRLPFSSGVFLLSLGNDAMIPPLAVLCTHVFTLSLERIFRRW